MRRTILVIASLAILAGCNGKSSPRTVTLLSPDGSKTVSVLAEIAETPDTRTRGLMSRPELPENAGMLFIFKSPAMQSFWMQNTIIPLDVFFFSDDGRFINAYTMQPCTKPDDKDCPTYDSAEPAQYVLETNAGFREKHDIRVGWTIDLSQINKFADPR